MLKKIFYVLIFVFIAQKTQAQLTTFTMLDVGYVYQNQSFAEVGARLLMLNNDDFIYRLGASALLGSTNSKFVALPKLQADILINTEKHVDFYHAYYLLLGAEATTKYIAPKAGFSLFGLVDITGGYAFPFANKTIKGKELKGFNLNFTVNIPFVMIHDLLK